MGRRAEGRRTHGTPATAATSSPMSDVVRAIDAKASKSAVDALTSRIGEVQSELGTLGASSPGSKAV